MKRIMKKLMAGILTGAMVLGLAATASASSGIIGGTFNGTGGFEGSMPIGTVKIVLPTMKDNFKMIADPHGLIAATDAKAYKAAMSATSNKGYVPTFDSGNFFFENSDESAYASRVADTVDATKFLQKWIKLAPAATPVYAYWDAAPISGTGARATGQKWYQYDSTNKVYAAVDDTTASIYHDGSSAYITPAAMKTAKSVWDHTDASEANWVPTASDLAAVANATAIKLMKTGNKVYITVGGEKIDVDEYVEVTATLAFLYIDESKADGSGNKVYSINTIADANVLGAQTPAIGNNPTEESMLAAKFIPVTDTAKVTNYTKDSDTLKVINKSNADIAVGVTAKMDKATTQVPNTAAGLDSNNNKLPAAFDLVSATTDLVNEKDGKEAKPLMYMALVNDTDSEDVKTIPLNDPKYDEEENPTTGLMDRTYWVGDLTVDRMYTNGASGSGDDTAAAHNTMVQGMPKFTWLNEAAIDDTADTFANDTRTALNTALASATGKIKIQYDAASDRFTSSMSGLSGYAATLASVTPPDDDDESTGVKGDEQIIDAVIYIANSDTANVDNAVAVLSNLKLNGKYAKKTGDVKNADRPTITLDKYVVTSVASSRASLAKFEKAFDLVGDEGSALSGSSSYDYVINPTVPDDAYNAATFHLTGAINTVDGWDTAYISRMGITLVWDANLYVEGSDPDLPEDADPTVTVKVAAAAANDVAELEFTLGTGNKSYSKIAKMVYTNSSNKSTDVATNASGNTYDQANGIFKIKATSAIMSGSDWKIVFEDDITGQTKEVPFDIKTAS